MSTDLPPAVSRSGDTIRGNLNLGSSGYIGPTSGSQASISLAPVTMGTMADQYYDNNVKLVNPSKMYWQRNITGTFTAGSPNVTGVTSTSGATVGNFLEEQTNSDGSLVHPWGTTFPPATKIASGITSNSFVMSNNALVSGTFTFSIVAQSGNACLITATQQNGTTGDGYVMGAVGSSNPGDTAQGFHCGTRVGASGPTIGYGSLYREASYLMPAGAYKYLDIVDVITHNANADYYPGYSWNAFWINGQTGDIQFSNHTGSSLLSITEATGAISASGALSAKSVGYSTDTGVGLAGAGRATIAGAVWEYGTWSGGGYQSSTTALTLVSNESDQLCLATPSNSMAWRINVDQGNGNLRFQRSVGTGSIAFTNTIASTADITTTGKLRTGGTAGPSWTSGTGSPTLSEPKGSLYSRTDGGVGTTLYVSQGGGTWNAVAGV